MVKRVFAIASVTVLGGFVASVSATGCGSSADKDASEGPPRLPDGGVLEPTPPASKGVAECKAEIDFKEPDSNPPAPKSATACAPTVVTALSEACVGDPNSKKCSDARANVANKTCAECIFGTEADAQWKVVNLQPGEEPPAVYTQEGCVENVTGVKGCGHAYMTVLQCFVDHCGTCDRDGAGDCLVWVADHECKPYRISDEACDKATGQLQKEIGYCFPRSEDDKGIGDLFFFMAGVACGGLNPAVAAQQGGGNGQTPTGSDG